ncbi:unnamed protein product, partial [marine sediment metagenome]
SVTLGFSDCNIPADAGCEQAVRLIITITIRTDNTFFITVTSLLLFAHPY